MPDGPARRPGRRHREDPARRPQLDRTGGRRQTVGLDPLHDRGQCDQLPRGVQLEELAKVLGGAVTAVPLWLTVAPHACASHPRC